MSALDTARVDLFDAAARLATARELRNETAHAQAMADLEHARAVFRKLVAIEDAKTCTCAHTRGSHIHTVTGTVGCTECECSEYEEGS